jgi:membrane protease YdiL (CAAX protease family)
MRSITFLLITAFCFTISIQIEFFKGLELFCLILSCSIAVFVLTFSRHKILEPHKIQIKWIYFAVTLGLIYGCFKFYSKYFIFSHVIGSSKEADVTTFIETVFFIVIVIPLLEEFFFRGILFDDLKRMLGSISAIIITSTFFILLHVKNFNTNPIHESIAIMLPGVFIYVYLKIKTNNFLVSALAHISHNATVFLILSIFQNYF